MAKRLFDLAVATAALAVLAPVLAGLALVVRWRFGAPVLFRQVRPGLGGRPFTILKFRTMGPAHDRHGGPRTEAERITGFGRLLRAYALDELPSLWNVVRGDMSLVGPRPLLTAYLDRYTPEQARRHEVRPGVTGWAQVNGRNALGWDDRLALDVWYVDHRSLGLDLVILARTVGMLLRREGVHAPGHATMPEFRREAP